MLANDMGGDRTINTGGGEYREINNKGTYVEGNYYTSSQAKQNLAEAAAEIQQILQQLEKTYGIANDAEKEQIAIETVRRIDQNPALTKRVFSALQAGSVSALEQLLNHPAASFVIAALENWQKTKGY